MNFSNVGNVLNNTYQYTNKTQKNVANSTNFMESLQGAAGTALTGVEAYTEYLKEKYGNVMIKSVGKDQKSMDALGASTFGTGNVVIAPNILEQMANDTEKAAYYEAKIQNYFDSVPRYQAELSAMGHEIHSSGIVIHPDGTVTHYISGDLKPEVRAKIEAGIKAEQEAKQKRREMYQELSQEAADRRREFMEMQFHKQAMQVALDDRILDTETNYCLVDQSQAATSAVSVYENTIILEEHKMAINGIGTTSYPAGYETRRTERNTTSKNFAKQAAEAAQAAGQAIAVLHGADEGSGDIAIFSGAELVSGSSISVYKTQDFDPENPVYKVKIWDKSGNVTERMVDVSKVDPKNCDTAEMYAYTANLKERGKGSFEDTVLKAVVAKSVKDAESSSGAWSFSDKVDWVKIVNDIMQSEYRYGDLKGYMEWKKFLSFL